MDNMAHGTLRTIIIHKKNKETNGCTLTHRGLVNMATVIDNVSKCISPMILLPCVSEIAEMYKKRPVYLHPICGSDIHGLGAEQASRHYMEQRWPFDICICASFGLNDLMNKVCY